MAKLGAGSVTAVAQHGFEKLGRCGFACIFRRPLYSVLQEVFTEALELDSRVASASDASFDEVLTFLGFCQWPLAI